MATTNCPTCNGHGADPMSDNVNWLPCPTCNGAKHLAIELPDGWVQDPEWSGNPELGMFSYHKKMRTAEWSRRKIPVYVFGGGRPPYEKWGQFCPGGGPNSDLSCTGFVPDCTTALEVMNAVDAKFSHLNP